MSSADLVDDEDFALPRKKRDSDEMDITPMIDITFLLLIFFVVCSTMDPAKMGRIPEADNGLTVSADDSAVIRIENEGRDTVKVTSGNGLVFSEDEESQVSEIVQFVTDEIESTTKRAKQNVLIFADEDVKTSQVTRVQKIIGDAFSDLEVTYIAVKEQ